MTKWCPGTSKIIKILCTVVKNQGFAIFSSSRLRDPIWGPPGLRFGTMLALKMPPRPPQERPRHAQDRPRGLQDGSKSAQEASQAAPRDLQDRSRKPSRCQGAPGGLRGAIWDPFCLHFGPHLDAKTIPPQACGQLFACQLQDAPKYQNIAKNRPKQITQSTE